MTDKAGERSKVRGRVAGICGALFTTTIALVFILLPMQAAQAEKPARVMSLNVCTDQLVMLLAAPGQIASLSTLVDDPALSFLHAGAGDTARNRGQSEEVILATPDLVVTGTFSLRGTEAMLTRLGIRVESFDFNQSFEDVIADIDRMGVLLGRHAEARSLAQGLADKLEAARASRCETPPVAVAYEQNGIALGSGTLAHAVMEAAGLRNLAAELGYAGMTPFPLELLLHHRPDLVILPDASTGSPSLADARTRHPALEHALPARRATVPQASWTCGGPFTIEAVHALISARDALPSCRPSNR